MLLQNIGTMNIDFIYRQLVQNHILGVISFNSFQTLEKQSKYFGFRLEKSSGNRHDDSNPTMSPENGLVDADILDNVIVDGCGRKFVFSVAVIDWDPKPFERISKYYYEDGEIVKNYLRHASTGEQAKCDLGLDS